LCPISQRYGPNGPPSDVKSIQGSSPCTCLNVWLR